MKPVVADLSHWNKVTSFADAKAAGIQFIIHKATQGIKPEWDDREYAARRILAKQNGQPWGAYHWGTNDDVESQVERFVAVAKPGPGDLVALDWEDDNQHTMGKAQAWEFVQRLAAKLGRPIPAIAIYGGKLLKEGPTKVTAADRATFGQCRLWLSHYNEHPVLPVCWDRYFLHQYTGDGLGPPPHTIPGLVAGNGGLDLNVYDGTPEQLAAEWAGPGAGLVAAVETVAALARTDRAARSSETAAAPATPGMIMTAVKSQTAWSQMVSGVCLVVVKVKGAAALVAGGLAVAVNEMPQIVSDAQEQASAVKDLGSLVGATETVAACATAIGLASLAYGWWRHVRVKQKIQT